MIQLLFQKKSILTLRGVCLSCQLLDLFREGKPGLEFDGNVSLRKRELWSRGKVSEAKDPSSDSDSTPHCLRARLPEPQFPHL